jgi:hypothetical protein
MEVLYSSATVLLDLCANEQFIIDISELMKSKDMFNIICHYLSLLMNEKLKTTQLKKLRDLFMGIILNLACNIENEKIITYMLETIDILNILLVIVVDSRNDWPTHGSSQAIMQICKMSINNQNILSLVVKSRLTERI